MTDIEESLNRRYVAYRCAIALLLFLGTFSVLWNVFPYGDDFFYISFTAHDAAYFFNHHVEHYSRANGRVLVHLLDTVYLRLPRLLWQLTNAGLLTAIAWLGAAVLTRETRARTWAFLLSAGGIFALDITLTRQSIYWETGSFNYVWPVFVLLAYWNAIEKAAHSEGRFRTLPLLAFLAGATVEQVGMMAFGLTLLVTLRTRFIDRRRPAASLFLCLAASAAGVATVVLSPSVAYRSAMEDAPATGLLHLLRYNLEFQTHTLLYSRAMLPCWLLLIGTLLVLFTAWSFERSPGGFRTLARIVAGFLAVEGPLWVFRYASRMQNARPTGTLATVLLVCDVILLLDLCTALLLAALIVHRRTGSATPFIALILAFGAQSMMLVSPVYGLRNLLCSHFLLMIAAGMLVVDTRADGFKVRKLSATVLLAAFVLLSLRSLNGTRVGYAANAPTYRDNLNRIESHLVSGTNGLLEQTKLPLDAYGWAMPYHNDYYDPYYNLAFGLPADLEIIWNTP